MSVGNVITHWKKIGKNDNSLGLILLAYPVIHGGGRQYFSEVTVLPCVVCENPSFIPVFL
jgi:hypothetical protein